MFKYRIWRKLPYIDGFLLSIRGYLIINTLVYVKTRIYYGFLCVDFFLV